MRKAWYVFLNWLRHIRAALTSFFVIALVASIAGGLIGFGLNGVDASWLSIGLLGVLPTALVIGLTYKRGWVRLAWILPAVAYAGAWQLQSSLYIESLAVSLDNSYFHVLSRSESALAVATVYAGLAVGVHLIFLIAWLLQPDPPMSKQAKKRAYKYMIRFTGFSGFTQIMLALAILIALPVLQLVFGPGIYERQLIERNALRIPSGATHAEVVMRANADGQLSVSGLRLRYTPLPGEPTLPTDFVGVFNLTSSKGRGGRGDLPITCLGYRKVSLIGRVYYSHYGKRTDKGVDTNTYCFRIGLQRYTFTRTTADDKKLGYRTAEYVMDTLSSSRRYWPLCGLERGQTARATQALDYCTSREAARVKPYITLPQ